jgi:6-phosphogluconolactonase
MSSTELLSFPDARSLAETVAGQWLKEIQTAPAGATAYSVALSGGRIARTFFGSVVAQAKKLNVSLGGIVFFWGDERCVPPSDPESNFGMAQQLLLGPLNIAAQQIHRIRGEETPDKAATEAEATLRARVPIHTNGQPIVDLIFLGMGEDGHVASLFPEEPDDAASSQAVYRPVTAAKPPPQRITIGYPALTAARQVWVLASGPGKETALRESLAPAGRTPLARVLKLRPRTRVFTDIHS